VDNIHPETLAIDPQPLEEKNTKKTKAIIAHHFEHAA